MTTTGAEPLSTTKIMGVEREGWTHKVEIFDQTHGGMVEGYITGNYALDGELREIFLHGFGKEGSTLDGWTQFAAIVLSFGLQAGASFASIVERIGQMKFEPYGSTNNPEIPWVPSVPAYIVTWLTLRFGDDQAKQTMNDVMSGWKA